MSISISRIHEDNNKENKLHKSSRKEERNPHTTATRSHGHSWRVSELPLLVLLSPTTFGKLNYCSLTMSGYDGCPANCGIYVYIRHTAIARGVSDSYSADSIRSCWSNLWHIPEIAIKSGPKRESQSWHALERLPRKIPLPPPKTNKEVWKTKRKDFRIFLFVFRPLFGYLMRVKNEQCQLRPNTFSIRNLRLSLALFSFPKQQSACSAWLHIKFIRDWTGLDIKTNRTGPEPNVRHSLKLWLLFVTANHVHFSLDTLQMGYYVQF